MATSAIYVLYSKIAFDVFSFSKIKLNKCRRDFMIEIFMLYLSIPSRINFLQLGRYSLFGEQRFRRQFEERFDFFGFNKALSALDWQSHRCCLRSKLYSQIRQENPWYWILLVRLCRQVTSGDRNPWTFCD